MAINFGSTLGNGLTSAGLGASLGGPWGAAIGGLFGGGSDILAQLFGQGGTQQGSQMGEFFTGKPAGIVSANRFSPQQLASMQQLGSMGLQGLNDPFQGFGAIRDDAMNQFKTNIIPSILERFSASGDNALSSPSLGMQLNSGAQDFGKSLASMQSQYGLQNRGQLLDMLGLSLSPQYDNYQSNAQNGLFQQILPALGMFGTNFAGNYLGGMGGKQALLETLKSLKF